MTPHKFAILEVSPQCYAEIRAALLAHESRHCIADTGAEVIDMSGIAIHADSTQTGVNPCEDCARAIRRAMRTSEAETSPGPSFSNFVTPWWLQAQEDTDLELSSNPTVWELENLGHLVIRRANAVKEQAHVERPEERQQQKETEHVV